MAVTQPDVELDPGVDVAAAKAAPAAAGKRGDAERCGRRAALGGDNNRERARRRHLGRKLDRRDLLGVEPQQGDVGRMVAADDAGGPRRSVGKRDRDLAFFCQRFVGGHDQTGFPDEAGSTRSMRVH